MADCVISGIRILGLEFNHVRGYMETPLVVNAKDYYSVFPDNAKLAIYTSNLMETDDGYVFHSADIRVDFDDEALKKIGDTLEKPDGWVLEKYYLVFKHFGYIQSVAHYKADEEHSSARICREAEHYYDSLLLHDVLLNNLITEFQRRSLLKQDNIGYVLGLPSFLNLRSHVYVDEIVLLSMHTFLKDYGEDTLNNALVFKNRNIKVCAGYYLYKWETENRPRNALLEQIMDVDGMVTASFVFTNVGTHIFRIIINHLTENHDDKVLRQAKKIVAYNNSCILALEGAVRFENEQDMEFIRTAKKIDHFDDEYSIYRDAAHDLLSTIDGLEANRIQQVTKWIQIWVGAITALAAYPAIKDILTYLFK